jgi:hypothetical protein
MGLGLTARLAGQFADAFRPAGPSNPLVSVRKLFESLESVRVGGLKPLNLL